MSDRTWVLDIETYYKNERGGEKYTLKSLSTVEYIKDARWKLHGLAVLDPKGQTGFFPEDRVSYVLNRIEPEDTVVAHNWAFDGLALAHHYGFRHWKVVDTLLLANAVLGPARDRGRSNSLGDLAEELGLEVKGRLDPLEGVRDLSQEEWDYLALYAKGDVRIAGQIHDILLPRLSRPGFELWIMRHSLDLFIHKPIAISDNHLQDAIKGCNEWKREALGRVMTPGYTHDEIGLDQTDPLITTEIQLSSQKQFTEIVEPLCKENKVPFPMKKMPATKVQKDAGITVDRMIPALAKKDEGFQALKTCGVEAIEDLVNARLVQRSATTVMARLKKLVGTEEAHMSITYHGACTGRFTGGGNGWNPQNIPSVGRAVSAEEKQMAQGIRSCLRAGPGEVFVTVDASQIEARVLAWVAGQEDVVDAFGDGVDLYSDFIGDVVGEEVRKVDPSLAIYDRMTALRNVGKECILGLGFGMGWYKLFARLREHPQAAAIRKVLGPRLNAKFAKDLVSTYRAKYDQVPLLWRDLDTAFHIARKGGWAEAGCEGQLSFFSEDMFNSMHMVLPSGRQIRYAGFKKYKNDRGYDEWVYGSGRKIYGGLITENAVQAIARDHLVECMYAMEHMGYEVVLTVHDSIIARVKENRAEQCLADCVGMLSEEPAWGPTLRLDAEGSIAEDFN